MSWNKSLDAVKDEIRNRQEGQRKRRQADTHFAKAISIVSSYYGVEATRFQAEQEISNLTRKMRKGNLDDRQEALARKLIDAGYIKEIYE